jgi:5-methylcytosine-specific restriction endonuclease McrBC regulatory subunit McrC
VQPFQLVSSIPLGTDTLAAAEPDRLTEGYRPLLELCRLLAESLTSGASAGSTPCPAFLLDMERVFEQYLTRGLIAAFAGRGQFSVAVQPLYRASVSVPGQPALLVRPDIVLERAGRPVLVVDAKWKRLKGSPLVTEDIYQLMAYCTALGIRRALLVYPGSRDRRWCYRLARAPVEVEVRTLSVCGPREACARSLRRLRGLLRSP